MNKEFIIEIGSEELPNRFLNYINTSLSSLLEELLSEYRLTFKGLEVYSTPRRILVFIKQLADKQANIISEKQGPPHQIFYQNDQITEAGRKFMINNDCTEKNIVIKETKKGKYIFIRQEIKGEKTEQVLPLLVKNLINKIHLYKSMTWEDTDLLFIRPIRWLIVLFDQKSIPLRIGDVSTQYYSRGHRILAGSRKIKFQTISQIKKDLTVNHVIFDPQKRKEKILKGFQKAIKQPYSFYSDETLLTEVVNLVEDPYIQVLDYSEKFLALPADFISTSIIHHQRAFPVYLNKKLTNKFLVVLNNPATANTKKGNERVLNARLEDAHFFFQEDRKNRSLENFNIKLKQILFLNDLGTIYEKVERIKELSLIISKQINISEKDKENLLRAAVLCKADLASAIVYEFPELQGKAGMIYAGLDNESPETARAIYEHYLPRQSNDELPATMIGTIIAIADKIDNITGTFIKGFIPTGSEDPFQVRRYSLGIINLVLKNKIFLDIREIFSANFQMYEKQNLIKNSAENNKITAQAIDYLKNRYKTVLAEMDFLFDEINSVLNMESCNFYDLLLRIRELKKFRKSKQCKDLLMALKRMNNIIKGLPCSSGIEESLFQYEEEHTLYNLYKVNRSKFIEAVKTRSYQEAFNILALYKEPADNFFDKVLVMDKDEKVKNNRLNLLSLLVNDFKNLLDFSQITEQQQ